MQATVILHKEISTLVSFDFQLLNELCYAFGILEKVSLNFLTSSIAIRVHLVFFGSLLSLCSFFFYFSLLLFSGYFQFENNFILDRTPLKL